MENIIITKSGRLEPIQLEKIQERLKKLSEGLNVEYNNIAIKVANGIYPGVTTRELDELAEDIARTSIVNSYDYDILASRIFMDRFPKECDYNLNSNVTKKFKSEYEKYKHLICEDPQFSYMGLKTIEGSYLLRSNNKNIKILPESHNLYKYQQEYLNSFVMKKVSHKDCTSEILVNEYDYTKLMEYSYNDEAIAKKLFAIITETNYDKVIERPVHMFLRTAIHVGNVEDTFNGFMKKYFIHASPTLMNSGIETNQLASCFLINMEDNSESIRNIFNDTAIISKMSGGIGISLSEIRSAGSVIDSTMGRTKGIIPIMKCLNENSRLWDQGGKRKGKFAIYLEPWHTEIREFLNTQHMSASEETSCKDLLLALWVCDAFMEAVIKDDDWYLMCPKECPNLTNVYGDEFNKLYYSYVAQGKFKEKVDARSIFKLITSTMTERGVPYILFKDACNKKNNQNNIGTIKCSNLCAEIIEYTSSDEYAVCNLANVCLGHIMSDVLKENNVSRESVLNGSFEYEKIIKQFLTVVYSCTQTLVVNLNNCIDKNNYPVEKTSNSNLKHRPIGIGIQGLADVFIMLGLPFVSEKSKKLNKQISAHMYYAALEKSHELAMEAANKIKTSICLSSTVAEIYTFGQALSNSPVCVGSYLSFEGSPISKGILQPHMWGLKTEEFEPIVVELENSSNEVECKDWNILIEKCKKGVRNSLLLSNMPTQATSHIMNMTECFEPITQLLFKKQILSGTFIQLNHLFQNDMKLLGKWNKQFSTRLVQTDGNISDFNDIDQKIKDIYKTIWDIKPTDLITMDAERGQYICQTQSSNRYVQVPSNERLFTLIVKAYQAGLKTGCYYLRSKPAANAIKFTVPIANISNETTKKAKVVCDDDVCTMCQ